MSYMPSQTLRNLFVYTLIGNFGWVNGSQKNSELKKNIFINFIHILLSFIYFLLRFLHSFFLYLLFYFHFCIYSFHPLHLSEIQINFKKIN